MKTNPLQYTPPPEKEINRALFLMPSDRLGGAERIVLTLAFEAVKSTNFHVIDIFVLSRNRTGTLNQIENISGVKVHYTMSKNERGGIFGLISILISHRYSLVVSSCTHINAVCSLMRRIKLLRTSNLVTRESTMIFERDFGTLGVVIRSLYWLYGGQDCIVCQTERMRKSLNKHTNNRLSSKTRTVPNPIDMDRIKNNSLKRSNKIIEEIASKSTIIVWCGRLEKIKSPHRAIEAFHELCSMSNENVHLLIIGDGSLKSALEKQATELNLNSSITFLGYDTNPTEVMMFCDFGLLTSDIEGFPNVILEMLASGVSRVITTDCAGGLAEIPGVIVVNEKCNISKSLAEVLFFNIERKLLKKLPPPDAQEFFLDRSPRNFFLETTRFFDS